jgi:7-cyano-7-deazaguanine synthase
MSVASQSSIGLLASGGLDSCILLGHLLDQNIQVQPFYVRCGLLWEREELAALRQFCATFKSPQLKPLVVLDLPLADLYQRHWSIDGRQIPDAATPDEAVYLPGRNPLLLIKAALWCQLNGIDRLALAILASNPFADATEAFFEAFQTALRLATGKALVIERPFAHLHKTKIMQLGQRFPLELTFSCIAPRAGRHCGLCNKCAERQAAFRDAALSDPTLYAADAASGFLP